MKNLSLIILTSLFSSLFSFYIFHQYYQPDNIPETMPAHFVNYKSEFTNKKPEMWSALSADFTHTSDRVTSSVVNIRAFDSKGYRASTGSGVIVSSDGYIVTNYHVIEGANSLEITFQNKREVKAEVIGIDPTTDLALLKVRANGLPVLKYGDSDNVEVGEWVLAVGNPFNLTSTVTAGIVSAKGRNINILRGQEYAIESFIQTDAVVNPGNSGGALVNIRGELIGINAAIISETGGYEGYSFAIPSNLVRKVINDLKKHGKVQRAILGVEIRNVTDELAREMELPEVAGVLVTGVRPYSSASMAGIREGDVLTKINNVEIHSIPELQEQVGRYSPGDEIDLEYIRNGKEYNHPNLKLQSLNQDYSFFR